MIYYMPDSKLSSVYTVQLHAVILHRGPKPLSDRVATLWRLHSSLVLFWPSLFTVFAWRTLGLQQHQGAKWHCWKQTIRFVGISGFWVYTFMSRKERDIGRRIELILRKARKISLGRYEACLGSFMWTSEKWRLSKGGGVDSNGWIRYHPQQWHPIILLEDTALHGPGSLG